MGINSAPQPNQVSQEESIKSEAAKLASHNLRLAFVMYRGLQYEIGTDKNEQLVKKVIEFLVDQVKTLRAQSVEFITTPFPDSQRIYLSPGTKAAIIEWDEKAAKEIHSVEDVERLIN